MANFVRDIVVACPPDHVFDVLSNVERLPEFSEMTVAVRNGPGRAVQTATRSSKPSRCSASSSTPSGK